MPAPIGKNIAMSTHSWLDSFPRAMVGFLAIGLVSCFYFLISDVDELNFSGPGKDHSTGFDAAMSRTCGSV